MADIDARFSIFATGNGLKATADYYPPDGDGLFILPEEVSSKLAEMGITTGVKEENITYLCESTRPLKALVLAEAILPETGENARIEQYVTVSKRKKANEREDGSVDFRDLGEILSVTKGQKLYRVIPPTFGAPGKDIKGEEIPGVKGKEIRIVLGKGTAIDETDPNLVIADTEGELIIRDGILHVSEIHTVNGDIDFSTGNLKFKGSIKIGGAVRSGFTVEAGGSVQINGNIEDATVISATDVTVLGGFAGNGQGLVKAERDVFLKFVENQSVDAGRDIIVSGISYHSNLRAGRSIISKGGKGTIVGGNAQATHSVEASRLGSVACVPTVIRIGVDPMLAERQRIIEEEIAQAKETDEKLEQSIVFLYRLKIDRNGLLPPDKVELLEKLETARKKIPEKLDSLEEQKNKLLGDKESLNNAFASADISVFPKVKVYIGNQWMSIEDNLGPSSFKMFEGEIIRLSK